MIGYTVPQFVPTEVCLACEGCCRFESEQSSWRPKLTKKEILRKDFAPVVDKGYLAAHKVGHCANCTFFSPASGFCRTYTNRPFECELYPFVFMRRDKKIYLSVHMSCPYVKEQFGSGVYQDFVRKLKRYFNQASMKEFVAKNTNIAGDYKGFEHEIEDIMFLVEDKI